MLVREEYLKKITDTLSLLQLSVKNRAILHLFDTNTVAETFFAEFLNALYGHNLVNLNFQNQNTASVDLGDKQARIAYQVTSDPSPSKVQDAIDKFITHGLDTDYDVLNVLIIGYKQRQYTTVDTKTLAFDVSSNVIDIKDLIREAGSKGTDRLAAACKVIAREAGIVESEVMSDTDALRVYRSIFNRAALKDPLHLEGSMRGFHVALTELVELVTTGRNRGRVVAKPKFEFTDANLQAGLDEVHDLLCDLRNLYKKHVASGEIDEAHSLYAFHDPGTRDDFDARKREVIDKMNTLVTPHGMRPITFGPP